jgi:multidrug resistance efflux pump
MLLLYYCLQQEEEIHDLQKQISSLESEVDSAQTQLAEATTKLEATEKQLSIVSNLYIVYIIICACAISLTRICNIIIRVFISDNFLI